MIDRRGIDFELLCTYIRAYTFSWHVGRETDYGRVARDFEAMADFYIFQAIQHYGAPPTENPPMTIVPAEVAPSTTTAEPLKVAPAEAEPPSTDDSQQPSTATTTTSATTSVPAS